MGDQVSSKDKARELILEHAVEIQDIGVAYGVVRLAGLSSNPCEINDLVKVTMLELFDEGRILVFRSSWNEGYSVDIGRVNPLDRAELESELETGYETVDPPDGVLFFAETQPEPG